jgi:hypothetical protein
MPPIDEAEVRIRIATGGGESVPAARIAVTIAPIGIGRAINATAVIAAAGVAAERADAAVSDIGDVS